jgi:hypothetical protein
MKKSTYALELIFNLNERLFLNSLVGVEDEQASERISDHNNSFIWVATHTVWARYNILIFLGKPVKNPYEGMFENFRPYSSDDNFPSLEDINKEWKKASSLLKEAIASVTEEHLAAESPLKSPIGDFTNAGTLAFLAQHESYDIGQMAFLKKFHSMEAMKYN